MTYSGAKGVPDETGDVRTWCRASAAARSDLRQFRLCVELAILWAALGKARLEDLPGGDSGHAFPVLQARMDDHPHREHAIGVPSAGTSARPRAGTRRLSPLEDLQGEQGQANHGYPRRRELQASGIRPPELSEINRAELVKLLDDRRAKHGPESWWRLSVSSRWCTEVVVAPPLGR